eukprot:SAG11_NODE_767_length_7273_cov_3.106914_8_plen_84_part_00
MHARSHAFLIGRSLKWSAGALQGGSGAAVLAGDLNWNEKTDSALSSPGWCALFATVPRPALLSLACSQFAICPAKLLSFPEHL